jgi:uncharacterized membrane protein YphA (DoxX/SURF4 family)
MMTIGSRIYGFGVMALGIASLVFGHFDPGQQMPEHFLARTALAYAAGALMVAAAAAVEWRRTAAWGAAALTVYYALFVVLLMGGRFLLTDYAVYVTYENIAMQLAIAAGGLIVCAGAARIDAGLAARLTRLGRIAFGTCALVFGGAHFVYMKNTASLVPKWLPPAPAFWGYATGVAFVVAGVAILTGMQARLAAILMTAMLACFVLLVHAPIILRDPSSHWNWSEGAVTVAVMGSAWVVADSLARSKR